MAGPQEMDEEELELILVQLEKRLDRLRALYEQYFIGIEKVPPYQVQKDVVRMVHRLQRAKIKRAQGKFRANSLIQRYNTQKAYWLRSMREMEEGKHRTQVGRAERRKAKIDEHGLTPADHMAIKMVRNAKGDEAADAAQEARKAKRKADVANAAMDFMSALGGGTKPGAVAEIEKPPEPEPVPAPDAKPAPEIRGMSVDDVQKKADMLREMRRRVKAGVATGVAPGLARREEAAASRDVDREIYERFVSEKKKLNHDVDKLSYDAVKRSLEKQRAKTRAKHDCARVDFDVVVKDGNAFLKAVPVKS